MIKYYCNTLVKNMFITTVTQKGQATISKKVGEFLNISFGDKVMFRLTEDGVFLQ